MSSNPGTGGGLRGAMGERRAVGVLEQAEAQPAVTRRERVVGGATLALIRVGRVDMENSVRSTGEAFFARVTTTPFFAPTATPALKVVEQAAAWARISAFETAAVLMAQTANSALEGTPAKTCASSVLRNRVRPTLSALPT